MPVLVRKRKFETDDNTKNIDDKQEQEEKKSLRTGKKARKVEIDSRAARGAFSNVKLSNNLCYSNSRGTSGVPGPQYANLAEGGGGLGHVQDRGPVQGPGAACSNTPQHSLEGAAKLNSGNIFTPVCGQSAGSGTVVTSHRPASQLLGTDKVGKKTTFFLEWTSDI